MKILMVTPYFYPKIGGLENYVKNLTDHLLLDKDMEISIVTTNHEKNTYQEVIVNNQYKVYRLPIQFTFSNTPINFKWYFDLKRIIYKEQPDLVIAHAPVPFIADLASLVTKSIPFILTYHAGSMLKNKWLPDIIIAFYERYILRQLCTKADRIVCYSKEFIQGYLRIYSPKIRYIPPGVDTKLFRLSDTKKDLQKILYVGKLEKSASWKGVTVLLDAIKTLQKDFPKIQLDLVGEGDATEEYQAYAQSVSIQQNVQFVGPLQGEALAKKYQESTLLVLPSITSAESFGIVLIEAMASGLPVIGSNIGGIPGVIDNNKNGLLVQPNDSTRLANAIKEMLLNPSLMNRFGMNGRQKVEREFTWENTVQKFKDLIYELKTT